MIKRRRSNQICPECGFELLYCKSFQRYGKVSSNYFAEGPVKTETLYYPKMTDHWFECDNCEQMFEVDEVVT